MTPNPSLGGPINTKLGRLIHSWSITAGDVRMGGTCPGESAICSQLCYAARGFFVMPTVARTHARNRDFSRTPDFVDWMVSALVTALVRIFRVHVAGDFYNAEYVDKWCEIVSRSRRTEFFAYTRSWRDEEILPGLIRLSRFPNMNLWFSQDRQTGDAPLVRGIRRCYLAIDDVDAGAAPPDCDLVFRNRPSTPMKSANGVLVCPAENGVNGRYHHTCSSCGVCWGKKRMPRWEQQLLPLLSADGHIPVDVPNKEVAHVGAQSQTERTDRY